MSLLNTIPFLLLNSIGFMAVLYFIYSLIEPIFSPSPKRLYLIAVSFHFLGLIQFVYALLNSAHYSGTSQTNSILPFTLNLNTYLAAPYGLNIFSIIGGIYFLLLIFLFIKAATQFKEIRDLSQHANFELSTNWNKKLKEQYNLNNYYPIGLVNNINSPLTYGWLDPVILLPFSILNNLSEAEIKAILLHEIAHIERYDYLVQMLINLSHWVLYFNPFSYMFLNSISLQRELACDAWVVEKSVSPIVFSKALYKLVALPVNSFNKNPYGLKAFSNASELLIRLQKINEIKPATTILSYTKVYAKIVGILILGTILTCISIPSSTVINTSLGTNKTLIRYTTNSAATTTSFRSNRNIVIHNSVLSSAKNKTALESSSNDKNEFAVNSKNEFIVSNKNSTELPATHENYQDWVEDTYQWIKLHQSDARWSSNNEINVDSVQYALAENLIAGSVIHNYKLKKRLLIEKMESMQNQQNAREAYDFLMNSKEWETLKQYENWVNQFLKRHPGTFNNVDTLNKF